MAVALLAGALLAGCATPAPDAASANKHATGTGPTAPNTAAPVAAAAAATAAANPTPRQVATNSPNPAAPGATPLPANAQPAAPAVPPPPAPPPTPAPSGGPPPFATVIKDARRIDGPITAWQKEDKVWLELLPSQFNTPFLFSPKIKSGIGEAWIFGGLMAYPVNGAGGQQVIEFVRVHNQIRMQARNTDVLAKAGTPEARAVADSYSHSLMGAQPVASAPHPDRKSVLVEANGLFLSDVLGVGMMLQRGLRQGYSLDRSNTTITAVRGSPQALSFDTQSHWYSGSVGAPAATVPNAPMPQLPRFLPDSRSLLIGVNFSLAPLPEKPMPTRAADARVGLFSTTVLDFSDDIAPTPRQRHVLRWRLEKKDPAAEKSEPVKPITFWIDRNVPTAYREAVRAGVLEWNKAFDKIGITSAIKVEQQPEDANWDTLDYGYASVRWMMNADPIFGAIGPSHFDPRTGEILDADIAFEGISTRSLRTLRSQILQRRDGTASLAARTFGFAERYALPAGVADLPTREFGSGASTSAGPAFDPRNPLHARCEHGLMAAEQLGYALDVMEAAGQMAGDGVDDPQNPLVQQFVQDYVKQAVMHEVGHALGLRHNFRASRAYTEAQLGDAEFTRAYGTTGSVMEYNAVNLPAPGKTGGVPFQTALGPYDYWAIEYAYKPLAAGGTPAAEKAELLKIAARSSAQDLAFGTDEDSFIALDPETLQMDLGADPLAFAGKRLAIARDLFKRQESRSLSPERDYAVLRRSLGYALDDATRALGVLARQIGGVRTLRDFPGSGRDPLQPVAPQVQREAMDLMVRATLGPESLSISPALQRRLAPDYLDRAEFAGGPTDFALPLQLLQLQRAVLAFFMSDGIAARVIDNAGKLDRGTEAFQLSEIYQRLSDDVWAELGGGRRAAAAVALTSTRRELQRDYVNRIAAGILAPGPFKRADGRGIMRTQAKTLLARLDTLLAGTSGSKLDAMTRAHYSDSADTLRQALAAPLLRMGL